MSVTSPGECIDSTPGFVLNSKKDRDFSIDEETCSLKHLLEKEKTHEYSTLTLEVSVTFMGSFVLQETKDASTE
jgi:hypothetical protein